MSLRRRTLLQGGAALAAAAGTGLATLTSSGRAADGDYRALVVVFLKGGNDGHNMLVPTDAGYADYERARLNLALPQASLVALPGRAGDRPFGLHPALAPLVPLYAQQRLAFIANGGPLVEPATALQARDNAVRVPPFLMSHNDQIAIQQGWTVQDDTSGWAGRALELLPSALRQPLAAVTMDHHITLVTGRRTPVSFMPHEGARHWGFADLLQSQTERTQAIEHLAQWQFANLYEAEYARTFEQSLADAGRITRALQTAPSPAADFGRSELALRLRMLASVMPVFKSLGYRRQVFLVTWGLFDTHANQRGSEAVTQDAQLAHLAQSLAAFDATNRANGLDLQVTTVIQSDFGRTLRPGSGGGSEHAWGNHWFALGGAVAGGTVIGRFPSPVLGGDDDGDPNGNGRHVPGIATDQLGATLMQWMGLAPTAFHEVFPHLVNFPQKTIPLLHA